MQEAVWILKQLVLPPGGLILLGLLGLFIGRKLIGSTLLLLSLISLYLLSTPVVSRHLMAGLETIPPLTAAQIQTTDVQAIVVLGGGADILAPEYGGSNVTSTSLERVRYAATLSRRTGLPLIPSGGKRYQESAAEGRLMRTILEQEYGLEVLVSEEKSRTTWENALMLQPRLRRLGIEKVLLVTHAWHMLRAMESFEQAGIVAIAAPMGFESTSENSASMLHDWLPGAESMQRSYWALHERLGMSWYRLRWQSDNKE